MRASRRTVPLLIAGASLLLISASSTSTSKPKEFSAAQKRYWAFQPVVRNAPPAVKAPVSSEVDRFLAARLEEKGLAMNPQADKVTLIRRASLILTGLPPTPEEVQAFVADSSPNALEQVVDRLLASPHYGERWARHWLDVARYADSEGFKSDETRPNAWRYRDYVIRAFNDDKPYNRFVREQIAGDELYPGDADALVATGFNRNFPDESNAANIHQRRQELLNDITDTVGSAFLAMTMGCARCHDHKFDPILQKDYYRLQAFFVNTRIEDDAVLVSQDKAAEWKRRNAVWEARTAGIHRQIEALLAPRRQKRWEDRMSRFPQDIQDVITMEPSQRNAFQWQMYHKAKAQVTFTEAELAGLLKGADKEKYNALRKQLAAFDSIKPAPLPIAQTMIEDSMDAPKTHILSVGAYDRPLEEVQPGFLTILDPADARVEALPELQKTGRRTALANWLADEKNPLTARVMVNRVWHHHFGKGIVGSPNDFGVMGERPANRELLDWLTASFIADGWSIKKLHKRIMLTAAWQQSSAWNERAAAEDPSNKLLWHFNRRRLEGESIRDSILSVSGKLNAKMFGPGVFPPLPPGMTTRGGWNAKESADNHVRRSIYTFVRRNTRYPMMEAFDMPDTHESCGRRNLTTTPTQALEMINSEQILARARDLAARVRNDQGLTREGQIERAFKFAYTRQPSAEEASAAAEFLARQQSITGSADTAFADFCHALLNSNEFVYIN